MNLTPNTAIILTDQQGRIVTSNIEPEKYTMQDISSAAWFQEILKRKDGILTLQFMGEERLTAITSPQDDKMEFHSRHPHQRSLWTFEG